MRLGFISHSPNLTGAEKMMLNLATALAGAGEAECLVLVSGDGPMLSVPVPPRCHIRPIRGGLAWYVYAGGDQTSKFEQMHLAAATGREMAEVLRDWGADLVIVNTLTTLSGLLAAAELNLPCVVWIHGIIDSSLMPLPNSQYRIACDEVLLRCSVHLVCPSQWTADYFERQYDLAPTIIPNATEIPEAIAPVTAEIPTFSCLNTLDGHKGIATLLDASLILRAHGYDFRMRFYGEGALREQMEAKARRLDLGGVVQFCGRTVDVARVYRSSHALVTAAEIEPFGMTLIEAMSHGRPVIVSDTSGHREIVDIPLGFRCPTRSPEAFAWRMARIIDHPDEARRMGELGWKVARERYSYPLLCRRFAQLFSDILNRERALGPSQVMHRYAACRSLVALAG
jgi:glycosyltransferase involved in cell wall biosynthesis